MTTSPINFKDRTRPFCTVDAVIFNAVMTEVLVIERAKFPLGLALPGGHIEYGESAEQAVLREVKEETDLDLPEVEQFFTYSLPERDPRSHTISIVYIAKAPKDAKPKAGDDAAAFHWMKLGDALDAEFAFDHKLILEDVYRYLFDGIRRARDPKDFVSKYAPKHKLDLQFCKQFCKCGNDGRATCSCGNSFSFGIDSGINDGPQNVINITGAGVFKDYTVKCPGCGTEQAK